MSFDLIIDSKLVFSLKILISCCSLTFPAYISGVRIWIQIQSFLGWIWIRAAWIWHRFHNSIPKWHANIVGRYRYANPGLHGKRKSLSDRTKVLDPAYFTILANFQISFQTIIDYSWSQTALILLLKSTLSGSELVTLSGGVCLLVSSWKIKLQSACPAAPSKSWNDPVGFYALALTVLRRPLFSCSHLIWLKSPWCRSAKGAFWNSQ